MKNQWQGQKSKCTRELSTEAIFNQKFNKISYIYAGIHVSYNIVLLECYRIIHVVVCDVNRRNTGNCAHLRSSFRRNYHHSLLDHHSSIFVIYILYHSDNGSTQWGIRIIQLVSRPRRKQISVGIGC